jgi:nucleotide-binding universal stress UspA family protein
VASVVDKLEPLRGLGRYLVPVDGSDASYAALAATCDVARMHRADVSAIFVIEVPRTLPLDADMRGDFDRGEDVLTQAEQVGRDHKVKVDASMCQARQAGHAVVDEAIEDDVDAIVVGVDYHRPYGRFRLGRLPEYVLANAPCEVWLFRYAPPDELERIDAVEGDAG